MSKTVKCNPSWTACTRMLLEVVKHGDTEQAREDAANEILRGMAGYDAMLKKHTDYFDAVESEICSQCDGKGTLEDGDICDAPCDKCDGSGMACDHVYQDDGDPRCINCNEVAS